MKTLIELNVDTIGEQSNLSKEQEQAISDFIRLDKEKQATVLAKKLRKKSQNKTLKH